MKTNTLDDIINILFDICQKLNEKEEMTLWIKVDKAIGDLNIIREKIEKLLN